MLYEHVFSVGGRKRGRVERTRRGADCALGSREWAEPPHHLTAMCWEVRNCDVQQRLDVVLTSRSEREPEHVQRW